MPLVRQPGAIHGHFADLALDARVGTGVSVLELDGADRSAGGGSPYSGSPPDRNSAGRWPSRHSFLHLA